MKELDKDRNAGGEYAVLVSLLEQDNEFYNTGIVDIPSLSKCMLSAHNFSPMITLLRNAAMNALTHKNQLATVKAQNIDVTNFETELENWRQDMGRNYDLASENMIRQSQKLINQLKISKKRRPLCLALRKISEF